MGQNQQEPMPASPRYESAGNLISLAFDLSRSAEGVSLQEVMATYGIGRRTAERRLSALKAILPDIEEAETGERTKRWRLASRSLMPLLKLTPDDLALMETAAGLFKREGLARKAQKARELSGRLQAAMRPDVRNRTQTDLEVLIEAEGFALRPGPRRTISPDILASIRQALLGPNQIKIKYRSRSTGSVSWQRLHPYGLLYGNRPYLVAYSPEVVRDLGVKDGIRYFALDGIEAIELKNESFTRQPGFNLQQYAAQSFGTFQEKPVRIELEFSSDKRDEVSNFFFHGSQVIKPLPDGSLRVSFTAGGLHELCWHLFTWGSNVRIVRPARLQQMYAKLLKDAARALDPKPVRK